MNLTDDSPLPKYAFFLINAVYMIGCISILVIAGIIHWNVVFYDFFTQDVASSAIMLLISSCCLIVVGIFGYFGAIRENKLILFIFAGVVGVLAVIQLAAGILALSLYDDLQDDLRDRMIYQQELYVLNGTTAESREAIANWDNLQNEYFCCGVDNYTDWTVNLSLMVPPDSCKCRKNNQPCINYNTTDWYSLGCYQPLSTYMHKMQITLGCLALIFFAFLLLSIGIAQMLANDYAKREI